MTEDEFNLKFRRRLAKRDRERLAALGRPGVKRAADDELVAGTWTDVGAHVAARVSEAVKDSERLRTEVSERGRIMNDRNTRIRELEASLKDLGADYAELGRIRDRLRAELAGAKEQRDAARRLLLSVRDELATEIAERARLQDELATLTAATSAPPAPDVPAQGARSAADGTEPPGEAPAKAKLPQRRRTAPKPAKEPAGDE